MATDYANHVNRDWQSGIAGVRVQSPPAGIEILNEVVGKIQEAVKIGNGSELSALMDVILAKEESGRSYLTAADLRYIIERYGGNENFKNDLTRVLPPQHIFKLFEVRRAANNGDYLPEDYEAGDRARRQIAAQREISQKVVVPLAKIVSGVYATEFLAWLSQALDGAANELADQGYPLTATVVATVK